MNLEADYGFNAKITLYRTKNGKPRSVALNRAAYEALATLEPNQERRRGPVFTRRNGQPWGDVDTAFRSALKNAGIEDCTFHDLRHTAASHLVMRGRSLREVQDFMGHQDIRMTVRYAHLSPAHLRATAEALNGLTPSAKPDELAHRLAQSAESEYTRVATD